MDALFLSAYAIGLFLSGRLGDLFDAKRVHCFGLISTAIIVFVFAAVLHQWPWSGTIWFLNGLFQSLGWPTAVKLLWLSLGSSSPHSGALFGVWASNQCAGNIIGAGYVNLVHVHRWDIRWMFFLPAIQAIAVSLFLCLLVPSAPTISRPSTLQWDDVDELHSSVELSAPQKKSEQRGIQQLDARQLINDEDPEPSSIEPEAEDSEPHHLSCFEILKLDNVVTYCLCFACLKSVNYAMFFWLPFFETNNGFSAANSDYLEMSYNIGQIAGGLSCGYISDGFSKRTPTMMVFLVCAPIPIFLLHVPSMSMATVLFLTFSAGFLVGGPSNILSTVMAGEVANSAKAMGNDQVLSSVTGIVDGSGSAGSAVVCFALSANLSMEWVFGLLSILLICSAAMMTPLCVRDSRQMHRERGRENVANTDPEEEQPIAE